VRISMEAALLDGKRHAEAALTAPDYFSS
jgi:hypothetical protein